MCERNSCHADFHQEPMGCCCGGFHRRFITKKERLNHLEAYRQELLDEIKAVEEAIKELKNKK